jgi:hypothetical protein
VCVCVPCPDAQRHLYSYGTLYVGIVEELFQGFDF